MIKWHTEGLLRAFVCLFADRLAGYEFSLGTELEIRGELDAGEESSQNVSHRK